MVNWSTAGNAASNPEVIERIEDVSTTLVQMLLRMPNSTAADKLIYENAKKDTKILKIMRHTQHTKMRLM